MLVVSMGQMFTPQSQALAVFGCDERAEWVLRQVCATLDMRYGHCIQVVVNEGQLRTCDGILLLDDAQAPDSELPSLRLRTDDPLDRQVDALAGFLPALRAIQKRRSGSLARVREEDARDALSPKELRALEQAMETWPRLRPYRDEIRARGSRHALEQEALAAIGEKSRDSLSNRFRWRDLGEQVCLEHGS